MADPAGVAISRAFKAKALLDNPEFQAAFESVRVSILDKIEACPIRDKDGLYTLKLELKILKDVQANIQHVVNTGKVIESNVSFLQRAKKVIHG